MTVRDLDQLAPGPLGLTSARISPRKMPVTSPAPNIATVTSPTIGEALWSPAVDRNTGAAGIFTPPEAQIAETGVLAEGHINAPGWITATIDLAALRRIRTTGEMRNDADWRRQPGVAPSTTRCDVVSLL